jgi:zinc transport system substrate-binding protein
MVTKWMYCLAVLVLVGCGSKSDSPATTKAGRKQIYTTSYPLAYAAQRIVGNHADVVFPAPHDGDPVFWEPDAKIVRKYQMADLILINGAGGEKWVLTATLPETKVINTSASFKKEWLMYPEVITHSHGPGGAHSHGNMDFNTWLDPVLFGQQVATIEEALTKLLPDATAELHQRAQELQGDLKKLDEELAQLHVPVLLASHPVYNYLSRRYRWDLHSVHWEPEDEVTEAQWKEFDALREKHPATVMLWEGEPLPSVRSGLEKRGVKVVVFDPCGNTPSAGDYLSAMKENIKRLADALSKENK